MTPLRQRFLDELARRNYAPRTVEAYLAGVVRFVRTLRPLPRPGQPRRPARLPVAPRGPQVSWSQFNQAACALRFFYRHVLGRPDFVPYVPFGTQDPQTARHPQPRRGPPPARRRPDPRDRLMLRLAYGCGLRLGEVLHLRVADLDSARGLLWVRGGKGGKDRGVPLPACLLTSCVPTGASTGQPTTSSPTATANP